MQILPFWNPLGSTGPLEYHQHKNKCALSEGGAEWGVGGDSFLSKSFFGLEQKERLQPSDFVISPWSRPHSLVKIAIFTAR